MEPARKEIGEGGEPDDEGRIGFHDAGSIEFDAGQDAAGGVEEPALVGTDVGKTDAGDGVGDQGREDSAKSDSEKKLGRGGNCADGILGAVDGHGGRVGKRVGRVKRRGHSLNDRRLLRKSRAGRRGGR